MTRENRMRLFNLALGAWLKEARIKAEMSIDDAVKATDLSREIIEDLEAGDHEITGGDFYKFLSAYNIPNEAVNDFLEPFGMKSAT